jgi:hypothetical protein
MNTPSEEIELKLIVKTIIKTIFNFIETIVEIFKITLINYKKTLTIILITSLFSIGLYNLNKPTYRSELIIETNKRIGDQRSEMLISSLSFLLKNDENYHTIAKLLLMDEESVKKINSIQFQAVKISDTLNVNNPLFPFKIIVNIADISILPLLQESLLNYLKNNKYVIEKEKIDLEYFENYSCQIDKELKSLDSLKSKIIGTLQTKQLNSGVNINNPIDPVNIYLKELELYNLKYKIDIQKKMNNSFEILQNFTASVISDTTSFNIYILYGISIGFALSLILALYEFTKNI